MIKGNVFVHELSNLKVACSQTQSAYDEIRTHRIQDVIKQDSEILKLHRDAMYAIEAYRDALCKQYDELQSAFTDVILASKKRVSISFN